MLSLFRPTIRRVDMDAVLTRLAEDSIGVGRLSTEFSLQVAHLVGHRHGVSFRSYAAALRAAVGSLALPIGSRVGVSALAPSVVARVLGAAGHEVVVIDTQRALPILPSPLDHDYQCDRLAALVVDRALGYHPDGVSFAQLGIPVIEDLSHVMGTLEEEEVPGAVGELVIVGCEPEHAVTAGGGATVTTNSARGKSALSAAVDPVYGEPRLPDMNAALGLTQVKQLPRFLSRRRDILARYLRAVQRGAHHVPLQGRGGEEVFPALPVVIDSSPREVEKYARKHGVQTRRAFEDSVFAMEGSAWEEERRSFPNAVALAGRTMLFPLYPSLSAREVELVERVLTTLP